MELEKINEFVEMINDYKCDSAEPKEIKIIFGAYFYNEKTQNYTGRINIYKKFGSVAFLLNDSCNNISSETRVWNILLGSSSEDTKRFFTRIKSIYPYLNEPKINFEKLVDYLYFEKGLLLLNRMNKGKTVFEWFIDKNVTDVLFLGVTTKYKSLARFFPNARMGVIYHPSNKAGHTAIYENLNSDDIKQVSYRRKKYERTKFDRFNVVSVVIKP